MEWQIPRKDESLVAYARRFSENIIEDDAVLIGVSFGGIIAQEISLVKPLRKLIIISSIKTKYELPTRLKLVCSLKLYNLLPTNFILKTTRLTKFSVGSKSEKRLKLYEKYLSVRDKEYLDWAIKQMVCWNRTSPLPHIVHIHGNKDLIFPIKNIKKCQVLEGGTHIMILNKHVWLNKHLPEEILA